MKLRVISGIVGTIAVFLVLLFLPAWVLNVVVAALCAMAMVELLVNTHHVRHRGVWVLSVAFAACTPFYGLFENRAWIAAIVFLYFCLLVVLQIAYHKTLKVEETGFAFFMAMTFPVALSCLAYVRGISDRDGVFYVLLALAMAWLCDIGAYFAGTFFGKHKLCPTISPKKTWEGLIGGIVVELVLSVVMAAVYQHAFLGGAATISYTRVLLLAVLCAPLSVLGDLMASIIKRQSNVKDFGQILPGHGGVMDRFDSLLLVAPLTYLWLQWFPLIAG